MYYALSAVTAVAIKVLRSVSNLVDYIWDHAQHNFELGPHEPPYLIIMAV